MAKKERKVLLVSFGHERREGIRILCSIIKKVYDTSLLYFSEFDDYSLIHSNKRTISDLNAVSSFCSKFDYILLGTTQYESELTFAFLDHLRTKNLKQTTIIGGAYAVSNPRECLKHADYVCIFEGDGILDLLHHIDKSNIKKSIGNFRCNKDDLRLPTTAVTDLDSVPPPDFSGDNEYHYIKGKIVRYHKEITKVCYESTRGCVFSCYFCHQSYENDLKARHGIPIIRKKTIKRVIEELDQIKKDLPFLSQLDIIDDNFIARPLEEISEFVELYNKRIGVYLILTIDLRSSQFKQKVEALSRIEALGLVQFGVQTGSEKFNKRVYNRSQANKDIIEKYSILKEKLKKTEVYACMMYGHPEESIDTALSTINLMLKLQGARFLIFQFTPLAGTVAGEKYTNTSHNSYEDHSPKFFDKYAFYYFYMFVIDYLNNHKLSIFLPKTFKKNILTDILNNRFFTQIYHFMLNLYYFKAYFYTRQKKIS